MCALLLLLLLQLATCQDITPISGPGKKFKCPAGTQYNPQAGLKTGPTTSVCCVVRAGPLQEPPSSLMLQLLHASHVQGQWNYAAAGGAS